MKALRARLGLTRWKKVAVASSFFRGSRRWPRCSAATSSARSAAALCPRSTTERRVLAGCPSQGGPVAVEPGTTRAAAGRSQLGQVDLHAADRLGLDELDAGLLERSSWTAGGQLSRGRRWARAQSPRGRRPPMSVAWSARRAFASPFAASWACSGQVVGSTLRRLLPPRLKRERRDAGLIAARAMKL